MHPRRAIPLLFLALPFAPPAFAAAQDAPAPAADDCACLADFDALSAKVDASYVALAQMDPARRAEYQRHHAALRERAAAADGAECVHVLRALTDWFRDGHLFVVERPRLSPEERAARAAAAERYGRAPAELERHLRTARGLDPVEGIWYAKDGSRVAVVRDGDAAGGGFVAVVLADTAQGWEPGHVRGRFRPRADGAYDAVVHGPDHAPRHYTARLQRGGLLHMPPLTWGREGDATLDPADPRAPTLAVREGAVVVSLPSHDPAYRPRLDSLLAAHAGAIASSPVLVVDLRGNEGGSSGTTQGLRPFYQTRERLPRRGPQGPPAVLVSEDNLAYFQQLGTPAPILERLRARMGEVVEVPEAVRPEAPTDTVTEAPMPRRVALLVDRHVMSAGEAFVLDALRSPKVTLFGEPTAGVIDYQNVRIVGLSCRPRGLLLGYPTLAASASLPADGLNATGIAPHVSVPADVEDPVAWVIAHPGGEAGPTR